MKKLCIVLIALSFLVAACAAPNEQVVDEMMPEEPSPQEVEQEEAPQEAVPEEEVLTPDHVFSLSGDNFNFYNEEGETAPSLIVQEGDLVRVEFESVGGMHDWVVDEFSAATEIVSEGDGVTVVEFVADQTGEFEYYCSVGSHRANGMVGSLVVE